MYDLDPYYENVIRDYQNCNKVDCKGCYASHSINIEIGNTFCELLRSYGNSVKNELNIVLDKML